MLQNELRQRKWKSWIYMSSKGQSWIAYEQGMMLNEKPWINKRTSAMACERYDEYEETRQLKARSR